MPKVGRNKNGPDPNQSQLGYMFPVSVTSGAPFGNDNTEKFRVKLIAGKPELIPEDKIFSPRQAPPTPVKTKWPLRRREFDTQNITTYPESLYVKRKSNDQQDSAREEFPTGDRSSREIFSPHKKVPPINQPEIPENNLLKKLYYATNGNTSDLPERPMSYTREDELNLKNLIQANFQDLTLDKCKIVYMKLSLFDVHQSGLVSFTELDRTLLQDQNESALFHDQNEVRVKKLKKDILRLVAAQFIGDGIEYHKVNYEKVLSYIRGALKELEANKPSQGIYQPTSHHDGVYRNPITSEMEDYGPKSKRYPHGERQNAKLRQIVETQLIDAEDMGMLPFETIWQKFKEADRAIRGMLSREQIHDLTKICDIPLQRTIMDQIIDRACDGSNGQYNWVQYLEFIEKVCPLKTGLHLPTSKKPKEYVKAMPEPTSNWPHRSSRLDQTNNYNSPRKAATDYTNPYDDYDRKSPIRSRKSPDWGTKGTDYSKNYGDPYDRSQSKQSELDSINEELRRLEDKFSNEKAKLETKRHRVEEYEGGERWFDRFLKMTDALYKADKDYTGLLPYEQAKWIVNRYNDMHYLGIPESTIENVLQRTHAKESYNHVIIENLADILSKEGQS